ncbi:MAG: hypothetical protein ACYTEW_25760 [Planctomycetota bacterium]|jgi:hypothetical protein
MNAKSKKKTKKKKESSAQTTNEQPVFVRKTSGNQALTFDEKEQLFALFVQNTNMSILARLTKVSLPTLNRYRDSENWEKRREQLILKTQRHTNRESIKAFAENMKIIRLAKLRLVQLIKDKKEKSTSTYSELDRILRLEEFMQGRPDARIELGKYEKLPDAELEEKLAKMRMLTGEVVQEGGE